MNDDKILVRVSDIEPGMRDDSKVRSISVEDLTGSVNEFLEKIESMLAETPNVVSGFRFNEFEVTAEVTAEGKLSLFGSGASASAKGGLLFRFQRETS